MGRKEKNDRDRTTGDEGKEEGTDQALTPTAADADKRAKEKGKRGKTESKPEQDQPVNKYIEKTDQHKRKNTTKQLNKRTLAPTVGVDIGRRRQTREGKGGGTEKEERQKRRGRGGEKEGKIQNPSKKKRKTSEQTNEQSRKGNKQREAKHEK